MIKVLQVVPFNAGGQGGIESFIMNIYRNIDRSKIQFDFLTYGSPSSFEAEIQAMGGKIYKLTSRRKNPLRSINETKRLMQMYGKKYDILHIHICSASNIMPLKLNKDIPITIIHSHASKVINPSLILYPISKILHAINKRYLLKYSNHFFACSTLAAMHMFGKGIQHDYRYHLIKNGIDLEKFKFNTDSRQILREKFNLTNDIKVIGFIGRFETVKNIPFLLHVFKELCQYNPNNYRLMLIGSGSLLPDMKKLSKQLGIYSNVYFMGEQQDVVPYLQIMDILIVPSLNEGLSITAIEAQACGLPCICSAAVPKEVNVTENVYFLSLKHPYAIWSRKIEEVLKHLEDRTDRLSFIKKQGYDIRDVSSKLEMLYCQFINTEEHYVYR